MALPPWVGDIKTGAQALGAVGDLFGDSGGTPNWARRLQEKQVFMQEQAMRFGVQMRVKDAEAAGVHPLYALGANVQSPSAVTALGESGAGRNRFGEASARIAALEAHAAAVEKDQAMADYYRALAAKERQRPAVASIPGDSFVPGRNEVQVNPVDPIRHVDWVRLEADPRMASSSRESGITAAPDHPGMRQFILPGGFRMLMPATSDGGMPEDIDIGMWPMILGANLQQYGWRWIVDALNYATGATPAETSQYDARMRAWMRKLIGSRDDSRGIPR